jgi:hypothetical protein
MKPRSIVDLERGFCRFFSGLQQQTVAKARAATSNLQSTLSCLPNNPLPPHTNLASNFISKARQKE